MDRSHGLICSCCQDNKMLLSFIFVPDACHIQVFLFWKIELVFLFLTVMTPFIKPGRRHDTSSMKHCLLECCFLCNRFRTGVDNQLFLLKSWEPPYKEFGFDFVFGRSNDRDIGGRKNLFWFKGNRRSIFSANSMILFIS